MKSFFNAIMKGIRFILCTGPVLGPVILAVLGIVLLGGSLFTLSRFVPLDFFSKIGQPEVHVAPVISEIKKMNRIYLLKVFVGFFDKQEVNEGKVKEYRITGNLIDANSFYWQRVRGHALISIDLTKLELLKQDPEQKKLKLRLPQPEVEAPTVNMDPDGTVVYQKAYHWYTSQKVKNQFSKEAMPRAQKGIEEKVANPKYITIAKDQAKEIFEALFKPTNWTVEIEWDKPKEKTEVQDIQNKKDQGELQ